MMRRLLLLSVCAVLAASGVAIAIAQPPAMDPTVEPPPPGTPPEDLTPADRARRAKRVAKIGAVEITVGDVEDAVNAQSPFLRARYQDQARLREFVQQMIRFELLAAEAERRGYGDNDAVVRSVKQNSVQALIRQEFDERITPESLPESDVEAYYESHEAEFHRDEMVRASHILLADRERAAQLAAELREGDARAFRQAAREHSIDRETKLRGGDLRYFNDEGRAFNARDAEVDQNIVAAAFRLREVGDVVSEPVQVGENWSIIKLTGRRPAEHRSLEDSAQGIRLRLWRERRQQAIEDFVRGLRERYAPEVHDDRMAPIRLDTTPTEEDRGGFAPRGEAEGTGGMAPGTGMEPQGPAQGAEAAPAPTKGRRRGGMMR